MIRLSLSKFAFFPAEPDANPAGPPQIRLIFLIPFRNISGKHPKIDQYDRRQRNNIQDLIPCEHGQDHRYDRQPHDALRKGVHSVSSLHETYQFFFHVLPSSLLFLRQQAEIRTACFRRLPLGRPASLCAAELMPRSHLQGNELHVKYSPLFSLNCQEMSYKINIKFTCKGNSSDPPDCCVQSGQAHFVPAHYFSFKIFLQISSEIRYTILESFSMT